MPLQCVSVSATRQDLNLTADDYRWASLERIRAAEQLHGDAMYSSAIYFAGVAVECILRAYRVRIDPAFDSRHDLADLLKASGLRDYASLWMTAKTHILSVHNALVASLRFPVSAWMAVGQFMRRQRARRICSTRQRGRGRLGWLRFDGRR